MYIMESRSKSKTSLLRVVSHDIKDKSKFSAQSIVTDDPPDIICLVNSSVAQYEYIQDALEDLYIAFQIFVEEGDESGTVILCNKNTTMISDEETPYYFDYPLKCKGRIIGTGVVHLNSKITFNILTAELDHDVSVRNTQLDTLSKVVKDMKDYIIAGDLGDIEVGQTKDAWVKMGCPVRCRSEAMRTYYDSRVLIPKLMSLIGTKTEGLETVFLINKGGIRS
jgi:hypothetical protein